MTAMQLEALIPLPLSSCLPLWWTTEMSHTSCPLRSTFTSPSINASLHLLLKALPSCFDLPTSQCHPEAIIRQVWMPQMSTSNLTRTVMHGSAPTAGHFHDVSHGCENATVSATVCPQIF
ncbi:uncharacterized protein AB9W97_014641 [Spinachia spinachia]